MRISAETKALMFSGAMYNDLTSELVEARAEAVRLSNAYNATWGQSHEVRDEALRRLLRKVGPGSLFEPVLRVEFGENITIGRSFFANFDCVILDGAEVTMETTSCSVLVLVSTHRTTPLMRKNALLVPAMRSR
jgi:maltose O-acetyltransferase